MVERLPSAEFLTLVQHVELSRAGWWEKTVERFVLAVFWGSPNGKTAAQISTEIRGSFSVDLDAGRLGPHLDRLASTRVLMRLPGHQYILAEEARLDYKAQLDRATSIETAATRAFESQIAALFPSRPADELWRHFHAAFLLPLIKDLGATTYNLLTGQGLQPAQARVETYLGQYGDAEREPLRSAIYTFLDPSHEAARSYVLALLNAYLVVEAVSLSASDLATVMKQLASTPAFNVFVDTNFLLSILGLHDNPSNEAAQGLIRLAKALSGHIKVRFYVLPLTIEETQRVLSAHRDQLKGLRLSPGMAQAALNRASSGITMRFLEHVGGGGSPNSAEEYFEPYINNLVTILRSHGAELFNQNLDSYRTRQDVIDDIALRMEQEKKSYEPARRRSYEQLLHDTVLWHVAADKRPARAESPVDAGYWIVTLDYRFIAFDRFKRRGHTATALCLEPTVLSRLLQFWLPRSPELEEVVLGGIRMPLMFHAFDRDAERVTVDILRALGRYQAVSQLPKEAIAAIMVNDVLRARMGATRTNEQKIALVEDALSVEFEKTKAALDKALDAERRSQTELAAKEAALETLREELAAAGRAEEEAERLKESAELLKKDIQSRDAAIDGLREQIEALGRALDGIKNQSGRSTIIRTYWLKWTAVEFGLLLAGLVLALIPGWWLGLRYWPRVTLLAVCGQLPLLLAAAWDGRRLESVRDSRTFGYLLETRKWLGVAIAATLVALFHELLAAWFQRHVWQP